jgi:drug/metabolite transporter (DMT)-like permease
MTKPSGGSINGRIIFAFIATTLIWGSTWMVIRTQLGVVDSGWSICYRFVIASAAMFAYAAFTGLPLRLTRSGFSFAALLGVMQFFLNYSFVYRAEGFVTSGLVAMISALLFVPNALFGRLFLGQHVTRQFVVGSVIASAGMVLLFRHEVMLAMGGGPGVVLGIGFTVLAMICASIGNVMQASERARTLPSFTVLAWSMLLGAGMNALFAAVRVGAPTIDPRPAYVAGVLYLGLLGSAVTFPLYYYVIRTIGPARAAYSVILVPVIAMILSTLFEAYIWSLTAVGGTLLAVAGLIIALRARKPAA